MPPEPRFLVVEYDGRGLPFVDWAHARPGVAFDMIIEPQQGTGEDRTMPALALVRGLQARHFGELDVLLDAMYSPRTTMRREPRTGEWLGRITIHLRNMASPQARAVARHGHRFGAPWSHVDDGVVYMRMRIADGEEAEALAADVRRDLAATGAEAQVMVESYSTRDYSVWDRLVQASLGLAT